MKLTPLPQGQGIKPPTTNVSAATEARAKAIAMLTPKAPDVPQVANQTQVSPEEFSAVKAPSRPQIDTSPSDEETQVLETTSEEPQEEQQPKKVEPPVSSQHALLARKEKALRAKQLQMEQQFKAREEALKARESEFSSKSSQVDLSKYIPRDQLKTQTLRTLAEEGISYDELTQQIINQAPTDPRTEAHIARLEAQIAKLEESTKNNQENANKQQQEAYKAAVHQIRMDAKSLVNSDPTFELVKATGSINDVVELIEKTFQQDGIVMTVEDAAQEVENYLVVEAEKLARLSKIQNRLKPVAKAPINSNAQTPQPTPKQTQPMKTLTNASASSRQLSARERALLAFRGELKS